MPQWSTHGTVVLAACTSLVLAGCAAEPLSEATIGIARGGERSVVLGVVVVCSGSVDGFELSTDDTAPLLIGDGQRRITRWVAPEFVGELGATDLVGRTIWPAETVIDRFYPGVDYALDVYTNDGTMLARPVVFNAEQFDTLSEGEVLVGNIRDGTAAEISVQEFLGLACEES